MQNSFFSAVILGVLLSPCLCQAQEVSSYRIDTGRINGALFRIIIPSKWNNNLLMYAHGYESPSVMHTTGSFQNPSADMNFVPFLDRGYAVARSSYRKSGWALTEGVDDTEALRQYFVSKYGKPDTCFITGHSMGGGITLATIENFQQHYNGAMPMCPLASRPYIHLKMTFDINAVFSALFPGVIPPLDSVFKGSALPVMVEAVEEAIKKDTLLAAAIAGRFELKPKDLARVIRFNDGILRDIGSQAGGCPFDNTNTQYSGFPDDWELNRKVERLLMTPGTENFFKNYDRSGLIDRPTLLLHTIYDQLIPASMAVISYDNMVQDQGKKSNLVVLYTNGQAHCSFTSLETMKAFDLLRKWASEGKKPQPGILE